ncbi:rhodanese-like domain-containing protein [Streptomyces sp. NPDC020917]|uniref:rhodanese-like domain-containing protein n=1 Tax=Streptomyces sp. NPDC020917 TaxID=3365102 RepID=UPI0037BA48B8
MAHIPGRRERLPVQEAHTRTGGHPARAVLLDVRENAEWAEGHAPGAVHAPLTDLIAGAPLPQAARDRPLVVICRSGQRSQHAVELLVGRGADAADVEGGMNAWAAAGYAVVGEHGNTGATA